LSAAISPAVKPMLGVNKRLPIRNVSQTKATPSTADSDRSANSLEPKTSRQKCST